MRQWNILITFKNLTDEGKSGKRTVNPSSRCADYSWQSRHSAFIQLFDTEDKNVNECGEGQK